VQSRRTLLRILRPASGLLTSNLSFCVVNRAGALAGHDIKDCLFSNIHKHRETKGDIIWTLYSRRTTSRLSGAYCKNDGLAEHFIVLLRDGVPFWGWENAFRIVGRGSKASRDPSVAREIELGEFCFTILFLFVFFFLFFFSSSNKQ